MNYQNLNNLQELKSILINLDNLLLKVSIENEKDIYIEVVGYSKYSNKTYIYSSVGAVKNLLEELDGFQWIEKFRFDALKLIQKNTFLKILQKSHYKTVSEQTSSNPNYDNFLY